MNCKAVQTRLSSYLDRELPSDELTKIRAHLHDCEACRTEALELRALKQLLARAPVQEPPADLADRLTARIIGERRPEPAKRAFRIPALTFAGIAALSMAVTLFILNAVRPAGDAPTVTNSADSKGIALQIQRDQVYSAGLDATSGTPLVWAASNVP